MQVKTEGIVFHSLKYSDNSAIVTIFTRRFGRVAYMIYGRGKRKSSWKPAFFQPLSIVELEVSHDMRKNIQQMKDVRVLVPYQSLTIDPLKRSIAMFIAEVLLKVLSQSEADESLYLFLRQSLEFLDNSEQKTANFHLVFLLKLSRYLGFEPNIDGQTTLFFDLVNGVFLSSPPAHRHYLFAEEAGKMAQLLQTDYEHMTEIKLSRQQREKLLEDIVSYYRFHLPDFPEIHSLEVLKTLFD
ncbi:MAG TPA: DNA repair protein RecO [Paludibacteraceae bacterium]|nr:DNA repair protein RecO [Paludibacteraceae bacterium]